MPKNGTYHKKMMFLGFHIVTDNFIEIHLSRIRPYDVAIGSGYDSSEPLDFADGPREGGELDVVHCLKTHRRFSLHNCCC